jgi:hypothetical protein
MVARALTLCKDKANMTEQDLSTFISSIFDGIIQVVLSLLAPWLSAGAGFWLLF